MKQARRTVLISVLALAALLAFHYLASALISRCFGPPIITERTLLCSFTDKDNKGGWRVSPDGRQIAFGRKRYGLMATGERREYPFDNGHCEFSPDGKRFAYISGWKEKKLILDETTYYTGNNLSNLTFSPDGRRIALIEWSRSYGQRAVVDGVAGPASQYIHNYPKPFLFSPDSRHITYVVVPESGLKSIVLDGRVLDIDVVSSPGGTFSPDSTKLVYAKQGDSGGERVVCYDLLTKETIISPEYEYIHGFTTSVCSPPEMIIFSPDGGRFCFAARFGNSYSYIVNGVRGKEFDKLGKAAFGGGSERFAYPAEKGNNCWFIVLDGVAKPIVADYIDSLQFSPDGERLFYVIQSTGDRYPVLDGESWLACDQVYSACFSSDSEHIAFVAVKDGTRSVVVDKAIGNAFEEISFLKWGPDDRYVSYMIRDGRAEFIGIFDVKNSRERTRPKYDGILSKGIIWDSPTKFHYLARDGDKIYLVEEVITEIDD